MPVTATAASGATRMSVVWPSPWIGAHPPIALRVSYTRPGNAGVNAKRTVVVERAREIDDHVDRDLAEHTDRTVRPDRHVGRPGDRLAGSEVDVRHDGNRPATRERGHVPRSRRAGGGQVQGDRARAPGGTGTVRIGARPVARVSARRSGDRGVNRAPSGTNAPWRSTIRSDAADEYTQNVEDGDSGTTANAPARAAAP